MKRVEPARIFFRPRWGGADGIGAILAISVPLILSSSVQAINTFTDRMFLAWYSRDAFSASLQAGMLHWTVLLIFFQTVGYCSTFAAQYIGAKEEHHVGPMMWQGIYMALVGGVVMACVAPLGYPLFRLIGHAGDVPKLEADYFYVLCSGSIAFLLANWGSSFFSGQNRTKMVLFVNSISCILNASFNVWVVFKPFGIIPTGVKGSALSTVTASFISFLIFVLFIAADRRNEIRFRIFSAWRFSKEHAFKLLKYGLPTGVHWMIDMTGFTTFMMVAAAFGHDAQFVSNMAMNVNLLLFIPAVGLHIGTQILAGQFCGARDHASVERMTAGALTIGIVYMLLVGILYIFAPELLVSGFRGGMNEAEWAPLFSLAKLLLVIVAFYSLFDAIALVYSGSLKGAGDTKFVMLASIFFSQALLTWPCLILWYFHERMDAKLGLYLAWAFCSGYVVFMATINLLRYRFGHWKTIDMIGPS